MTVGNRAETAAPRNKKVLIVAHGFPPIGGIGVQRPYKFTQYLPEFGFSPLILTQVARYSATWNPSLLDRLQDTPIFRASDPMINLQHRLRTRKERKQTEGQAAKSQARPSAFSALKRFLKRLKDAVFIPDDALLWLPNAIRLGLRVLREEAVDAIYVTSPPETSQLVAAFLSERTGIPLIADFRDPWVANLHRKSHGLKHRLESLLEAYVFSRAARVTTVTDTFRAEFISRYPQFADKIYVIPNGYDALEIVPAPRKEEPNTHMTIYYGGILYEKRSPQVFLEGLAKALAEGRLPRDRVRVRFAGVFDYPGKSANRDTVERLGLGDVVDVVGYVAHGEHVKLLAQADLLLLIGDQTEGAHAYIPAKLYEYLGIGRPVLALVKTGEASRLMEECKAGWVLDLDDVKQVADRLTEIYTTWESGQLAEWRLSPLASKYERREQSRLLAEHLRAITH